MFSPTSVVPILSFSVYIPRYTHEPCNCPPGFVFTAPASLQKKPPPSFLRTHSDFATFSTSFATHLNVSCYAIKRQQV